MSTFYTTKIYSTGLATTGLPVPSKSDIGTHAVTGTYELAAALVDNDVIQMVRVPQGAAVQEVILAADDLDTHNTPTIILNVGDGTTVDRYISASTVAQAGGVVRLSAIDGMNYTYTADDTIDVKVTEPPATGATSGTITLTVIYTMNP